LAWLGLAFDVVVDHAEKLHQLPDEYLVDMLPIAKKIAVAQGAENYNILQVGTAFLSTNPSTPPLCMHGLMLQDVE
jgi:hypothetical protein